MQRYLAARVLALIPVLLGILVVVFLLIRLIPGDAIQLFLGTQVEMTPEQMAELRRFFGVDRPIWVQFADYLGRVLRGDFGVSLRTARPVLSDILQRLPLSFQLATLALVVAVVIAVPLGVLSAVTRNSAFDVVARIAGLLGLSIPNFWLGAMLILVFSRYLHVALGQYVPITQDALGTLQSLYLPALALGTAIAAILMRYVRSSLLEVLGQEYIRTARGKGLRGTAVMLRHALPNAMIPVVTVIGFQMGYLLGGTVVIEEIFALPGMGRLALQAIFQRDYPVVQGVVLVVALLFVLTNLVVDLLYAWIDPRIRYT
ncbi:MAG: ABC transporter permease [Armatimonadota bacterium]|nr:ABC transporter permease [Armatimonadota bacterium]MDR7519679.1 ABC transporter permease [Armatimonadota bacterium]MDR7550765.1 ABC transporter permease [Armatimonadota bacterium]